MRKIIKNIVILLALMPLGLYSQDFRDTYFSVLAFAERGDVYTAILQAEKYFEENEQQYELSLLLADLYLKTDNIDKAENTYAKLQLKYPSEFYYGMAKCAAYNSEIDLTIEYLKKYFDSNGKYLRHQVISDTSFNFVKSDNKWREFWNKQNFSKTNKAIDEIAYRIKMNDYFEAINLADVFLSNSESHKVYYYRALANYNNKDYKQALKDINKAINVRSKEYDYWRLQSLIEMALKRDANAFSSWSKVLDLNELDAEAYLYRAISANNSGKYYQAHDDLLLYTKHFQHRDSAQYMFVVVSMNIERYWDAIQSLNILIDKDPSQIKYFNDLGDCFYKLSDWRPALYNFMMSLDINPAQGDIWFKAAYCEYEMSNIENACSYWHRAARYNYPEAQISLQKYCRK
jgi:tetratricopeptide (TPR) repeat protein